MKESRGTMAHRLFCVVARHVLGGCPSCSDDGICSLAPAIIFQPVGDDAMLIGYNEAMSSLGHDVIDQDIGTFSSECASPDVHAGILHCARTGQPVLLDVVRNMRTVEGIWHNLLLIVRRSDGAVVMLFVPMERVDVPMTEAQRERERE